MKSPYVWVVEAYHPDDGWSPLPECFLKIEGAEERRTHLTLFAHPGVRYRVTRYVSMMGYL